MLTFRIEGNVMGGSGAPPMELIMITPTTWRSFSPEGALTYIPETGEITHSAVLGQQLGYWNRDHQVPRYEPGVGILKYHAAACLL